MHILAHCKILVLVPQKNHFGNIRDTNLAYGVHHNTIFLLANTGAAVCSRAQAWKLCVVRRRDTIVVRRLRPSNFFNLGPLYAEQMEILKLR